MGLLLISGVLALRDATPPPPSPIGVASPRATLHRPAPGHAHPVEEGTFTGVCRMGTELPVSGRGTHCLSRPVDHPAARPAGTAAVGAMPQSRYTATVSVTYTTLDPDKRSVLLTVNLGDKTFAAPLRGGTSADSILDEAGKQLATQLSCQFGSTVWIAFGESEQITLTFLPMDTPNGPVGNPADWLPAGTPSPAAEKWHQAWIQWNGDRRKAAVVGVDRPSRGGNAGLEARAGGGRGGVPRTCTRQGSGERPIRPGGARDPRTQGDGRRGQLCGSARRGDRVAGRGARPRRGPARRAANLAPRPSP
jgi:hypothetical protein